MCHGDGHAVVLDADGLAFLDIGQNSIPQERGIFVTESRNHRHPNITAAKVLLGVGQLVLTADETLDITPTTLVNLSLIHIENVTGDSEISLADATVVEGDGLEFTINLTETQRVRAIEISATSGGDSIVSELSVEVGFVQDIGTNPNFKRSGLIISEEADVILPNLIAVTVDYNEGRIAITADETIDVTPTTKVNLTNLYLGNVLYTRDVHLPGGGGGLYEGEVPLDCLQPVFGASARRENNSPRPGRDRRVP